MENKFEKQKLWDNKIFLVVISFIASLAIWLYVTSTEKVERDATFRGIKVEFEGEKILRETKELILTSVENQLVSVRLSTNLRTLSKLSDDNITAVVDLTKVSAPGAMSWAYTLRYPEGVDENEITVLDNSPGIISFTIDRLSKKTVMVEGIFDGSLAEGFMAEENMTFSPNSVVISGPEAEISKVDRALVVLEQYDVKKTLTVDTTFTLVDKDDNAIENEDITCDTDVVTATLPVVAVRDIPLSVKIIEGGGATMENIIITFDPREITVSGDTAILDGINQIVLGTIDLADITTGVHEVTFPIVLDNSLKNLTGVSTAKVKVEIKGLVTKKFTVTNFSAINVTEGYEADILTDSLEVTIRADEETMKKISAENIRGVADLSDIGSATGIVSREVSIRVDGTQAGAVGDNIIHVSLRKK